MHSPSVCFRMFLIGAGLVILSALACSYAHAQAAPPRVALPTVMEGMDRMNYVMPITEGHPFCWSNNNPQTNLAIKIYRYRMEGGPKTLYLTLPYNLWQRKAGSTGTPPIGTYCTSGTHKVPQAGHWIYEGRICFTPTAVDEGNCSEVVSASCAAGTTGCAGAVADTPRGWWVYAFLPAPTGVGVD